MRKDVFIKGGKILLAHAHINTPAAYTNLAIKTVGYLAALEAIVRTSQCLGRCYSLTCSSGFRLLPSRGIYSMFHLGSLLATILWTRFYPQPQGHDCLVVREL